MRRAWMVPSLLAGTLFLHQAGAFAQTNSANDNEARNRMLVDLQNLNNPQNGPSAIPDHSAELVKARFSEFKLAIPKFREATDQFRWALSLQSKLDKSLQDIETQTDVMLRYLAAVKINHPKANPMEFKGYSPAELQWETLNSAERIGAFVDFAVAAENQETVSTRTLDFLYKLDGELLRLKWLTSHVK